MGYPVTGAQSSTLYGHGEATVWACGECTLVRGHYLGRQSDFGGRYVLADVNAECDKSRDVLVSA